MSKFGKKFPEMEEKLFWSSKMFKMDIERDSLRGYSKIILDVARHIFENFE